MDRNARCVRSIGNHERVTRSPDRTGRRADRLSFAEQFGLEGRRDLENFHAHLQGQRPACGIVGRIRRAAGIEALVGVLLTFEQVLGMGSVGLCHQNHPIARGVLDAVSYKRRHRAVHLDSAAT